MFKTIRENRNELIAIPLALLLVFTGLYFGKTFFPPLAYALSFFYYLAIAAVVFFTPWLFIRITLPNTMGKFVNEWFNAAWFSLGKPPEWKVTKDCHRYVEGAADRYEYAGHLQKQLKLTLAVHAVLVLAGAIIAIAAFSQGISIPVIR